jgi:hypothetical protein
MGSAPCPVIRLREGKRRNGSTNDSYAYPMSSHIPDADMEERFLA